MTNIEDVWKRLKGAYGDLILLLMKDLSQIGNISQLWKIRDQEELVDGLSKIVNIMRNLYQLAEQYNIKSRLYSDDGFERIYQMMGDNRVTRWLSRICEVEYNDEQTWNHQQQQKLLIQNKSENKRLKQAHEEKGPVGRYSNHFSDSLSVEPKPCCCEEAEEHIATNGSKGTKIVQYFPIRNL